MTVASLVNVMNIHIRLIFVDRNSMEIIERGKLNRRETLDFLERHVYMIFPTEEKDVLKVLLY